MDLSMPFLGRCPRLSHDAALRPSRRNQDTFLSVSIMPFCLGKMLHCVALRADTALIVSAFQAFGNDTSAIRGLTAPALDVSALPGLNPTIPTCHVPNKTRIRPATTKTEIDTMVADYLSVSVIVSFPAI